MPLEARKAPRKRKLLAGVLGVAVLAVLLVFGIPWVEEMLDTISTDDAYVNGHVTFVAPRVAGQISRVLVDDNNRVKKGDLLAELDKEPYRVAVSGKQAAVDTAKADLQAATAAVRAIEADAMSRRWDLQHAVENVDNQVALLHARVAAVAKSKAALTLAQLQFDRAKQLVARDDVPREVYDQRQAELTTAGAELAQTLAEFYQIRASLGLPAPSGGGGDLDQVPPDLDETFSSVLEAQAALIQSAAQLGVVHSFDQGPKAMLEQFYKLGDVDTTFARYAANAPAVKQAEAKLEAARRDLAQAELDLRYTDIIADIDGVVTRRNVNPGNFVQVGQNLMAVRSLSLTDLREILLGCNRRYLAHLSSLDDFSAGVRALERLTRPREVDGKTVKGLNFFDPGENALLKALQDPRVNIKGIRRGDLLPALGMPSPGRLSQQLRRLRELGVIKRVSGSYRYYLTKAGRAAVAAAGYLTEMVIVPVMT